MKLTLFLVATLPMVGGTLRAHVASESHPLDSAQVWTDTAGHRLARGDFLLLKGDRLVIGGGAGRLTVLNPADLSEPDQSLLARHQNRIRSLNTGPIIRIAAATGFQPGSPATERLSSSFAAFPRVRTRSDGRWFYVESDSMPDHNMMVGITAWQQQVPIPQPYTANNAWQIPLNPVPARNPMSAKSHFFRGAIALAVNGVPIYNPIKNDGRTDTLLAGELDNWGGHCGRGDDYHYHIAPVHLQEQAGAGHPIAWALDGYPIHGFTEPAGNDVHDLDPMNGHDHGFGYHYHATRTYPYLNGGFHGEVREVDGQVDPQPRPGGIRPYTSPLRGAKIVAFTGTREDGYNLRYEINGQPGHVHYKVTADRSAVFTFIDTAGRQTTESYTARTPGGGRGKDRNRGAGRNRDDRRDPILSALDADGDGELSREELMNAPAALRRLDRNGDGQLAREETQGQEETIPSADGPGRPERRGPPPPGEDRKPWIAAHLAELDADRDGNVSKAEMLAEAARTFAGYDRNGDGRLTSDEYSGRASVRSAMGGFVKEHSSEFDRDRDGIITRDEVNAFALRMFTKADQDANGTVTTEEANTRGGGGGKNKKRPR